MIVSEGKSRGITYSVSGQFLGQSVSKKQAKNCFGTKHITDHGESNGALNGSLNGELNEALKGLGASVIATYTIIKSNPGIQRKDIISLTKRSSSTIDRHLAILIERKLIEHRGTPKTGGYYPL